MNYLQNTFRKLRDSDIKVLGRWFIDYDSAHIKIKVYQANHDHCGVCEVPHLYRPSTIPTTDIRKSKYMTAVARKSRERQIVKYA
jgi:hypothetical protein